MKLRSKLVLIMGLCFALFSLALAVALGGALGTKSRFETFLNDDQALLQAGTTMYAQGLQMGQALRNIVLDPENKAAYKNLEEASKEFKAANDAASALASADPPTRNMISEVAAIRERQKPLQQKIISLAKTEQAAAIAMIVKDETPLWREMRSLLTEFAKAKNAAVAETRTGMVANAQRMIVLSVILGVMAVLAGVILMTWLVRNVMQQLGGEPSYAAAVAGKIAKGDLTAEIELEPNDRSSLLFGIKGMRDSLLHIVSQVRAGVDSMATAASQIAAGNQDLSSRTEEQASSLQETASSMEQLTTTVQQNADSARQANVLATSASAVAQRGGEVVTQVVDTMNSICASSKKIEDIIAVIDGIAFQTNILALNAAVEAARAGDQGRGFAVVASEVRSLAQRSANAAKEIKLLITDSVEKVDAGVRLVDSAGTTMSEIVDSIARVNNIMSEITEASQAQTIGIEQINQAINQLDSVTQQNAALVEEAAAAAESQQIQAGNLTHVVSVFHLDSQPAPIADVESERGFKMAARPAGPGAHPRTRALPRSAGVKRISNSGAQSRA